MRIKYKLKINSLYIDSLKYGLSTYHYNEKYITYFYKQYMPRKFMHWKKSTPVFNVYIICG